MRSNSAWTWNASPATSAAGLGAERIAEDVDGADLSGVTGTPTFFVNGRRHYGPYDIASLSAAVRAAEAHGRLEAHEAATPHQTQRRPANHDRTYPDHQ